jgi:coproporphyrinogen III oxidase-like Fe-S oxidoreductase
MLGLRLDEPLSLAGLDDVVDHAALERLAEGGLAVHREGSLRLTPRGRLLGGGVTARLLA